MTLYESATTHPIVGTPKPQYKPPYFKHSIDTLNVSIAKVTAELLNYETYNDLHNKGKYNSKINHCRLKLANYRNAVKVLKKLELKDI